MMAAMMLAASVWSVDECGRVMGPRRVVVPSYPATRRFEGSTEDSKFTQCAARYPVKRYSMTARAVRLEPRRSSRGSRRVGHGVGASFSILHRGT
jgi:hypothetical protein